MLERNRYIPQSRFSVFRVPVWTRSDFRNIRSELREASTKCGLSHSGGPWGGSFKRRISGGGLGHATISGRGRFTHIFHLPESIFRKGDSELRVRRKLVTDGVTYKRISGREFPEGTFRTDPSLPLPKYLLRKFVIYLSNLLRISGRDFPAEFRAE